MTWVHTLGQVWTRHIGVDKTNSNVRARIGPMPCMARIDRVLTAADEMIQM